MSLSRRFGYLNTAEDAERVAEHFRKNPPMKKELTPGYLDPEPVPKPEAGKVAEKPVPKEKAPRKAPENKSGRKVVISIHLSPEVVKHFRATGRDWHPRINQVLLDHIRSRA